MSCAFQKVLVVLLPGNRCKGRELGKDDRDVFLCIWTGDLSHPDYSDGPIPSQSHPTLNIKLLVWRNYNADS